MTEIPQVRRVSTVTIELPVRVAEWYACVPPDVCGQPMRNQLSEACRAALEAGQ